MSSWHAIDALDEALERTKKLLLPLRPGFWLKIALVAMLAAGIGGGNGARLFQLESEDNIGNEVLALTVIAFAAITFLELVVDYLSSVFKFVYVKSLLTEDLKIVEDFKAQAGNGLKVFLLRVGVIAMMVVLLLAAISSGILLSESMGTNFVMILWIVAGILALVALVLVLTILFWLLDSFAVPIMYKKGLGVMAALKETLRLVSADFWQFAVYLLLLIALGFVAAIPVLIFTMVLVLVVFAVFFAIGFIAGVGGTQPETLLSSITLTPAVVAVILIGSVLLMMLFLAGTYVIAVITLPISVFFRYYSLIFLDRVDKGLGLFEGKKEVIKKEKKRKPQAKKKKVVKVY